MAWELVAAPAPVCILEAPMAIETRGGRRVLVHEVGHASTAIGPATIASYELLMNTRATTSTLGRVEFQLGDSVIRIDPGLPSRSSAPKKIHEKEPLASLVARVARSGSSILGWFSLRRAWMFDGNPEPDARVIVVRDPLDKAWWFKLSSVESPPKSTLPVSNLEDAIVWYPSLFRALGWGAAARKIAHGYCVDLATRSWQVRLFQAIPWPFHEMGVQAPSDWNGTTGEVNYGDFESFDGARRNLESLGLYVRGSEDLLALTDPFGHEWYVGFNRRP